MNYITTFGIKWKSKDLANRNTLHYVIRKFDELSNKFVYFHIQRRLISAEHLIEYFNKENYTILRKYKNYYYIEEVDGHIEDTWHAISSAIDKLKRKLNES